MLPRLLALATCLLSGLTGCIDWDGATLSFCNVARVEESALLCVPDPTASAHAPPVVLGRTIGGAGEDSLVALVAAEQGGMWLAGTFRAPTQGVSGDSDGFLLLAHVTGATSTPLLLAGEKADTVVDLVAGTDGELLLLGTFEERARLQDQELSAAGQAAVVARLGKNGRLLQTRLLLPSPDARLQVTQLAFQPGQVVITGLIAGTFTVAGQEISGGPDPQPFLLTLDESLEHAWHLVASDCREALAPSVALGSDGSAYWAGYSLDSSDCSLGGSRVDTSLRAAGFLARVEPPAGSLGPRVAWLEEKEVDPLRTDAPVSPFLVGEVATLDEGTVAWSRPEYVTQTQSAVFWRTSWMLLSEAGASLSIQEWGASTQFPASRLRARLQRRPGHQSWAFGRLSGDLLAFGEGEESPLLPLVHHGFVRAASADPNAHWHRVMVGRSRAHTVDVTAVAVDDQGRTWIGGDYQEEVLTSMTTVRSEGGQDGFLFVVEPGPQAQ